MTYLRTIMAALLLLCCAGCASAPFRDTELVPLPATTAAELVDSLWSSGKARLLVRQSALFEFGGVKTPIEGVMRLDLGEKTARLVGMNDMGIKLFDIQVNTSSSEAIALLPELSRYPGFTEAVATSVRRIFLTPAPARTDQLAVGERSYALTRKQGESEIRFVAGGAFRQLLEKSSTAPEERWRVRYYDYRQQPQVPPFPGGIVLDDETAGYRLTLWLESVEMSDE